MSGGGVALFALLVVMLLVAVPLAAWRFTLIEQEATAERERLKAFVRSVRLLTLPMLALGAAAAKAVQAYRQMAESMAKLQALLQNSPDASSTPRTNEKEETG